MPSRKELANAVRFLSMDAVQKAKSGHPGAPMGMADMAEALWNGILKHNPANPSWYDRDRFVLSNGHASMLLYSLLHLTGYDLSIEDLQNFRQLGARTPGHPEYGYAPGVETTTGPLGQGVTNAVGMAMAEKLMAAAFNREGHEIVDHHTYTFLGDGCLMEGISHEACSLAGTLGLGKLIALYDDNNISIDGEVSGWFGDDTPARFEAYGWHVIRDVDGQDGDAVAAAITAAKAESGRPSLICCKTVIGFGAPNKSNSAGAHGSPLGDEEIALTRENLGWAHAPFEVPVDVRAAWDCRESGAELEAEWNARFDAYRAAYPELASEFERRMKGELPEGWAEKAAAIIADTVAEAPELATRQSSKKALDAFGPLLPEFFGGSADLSGSNGTLWSGCKSVNGGDWTGNYMSYGVREFAMAAIQNGMALHGGFLPYGGTFLIFSDYSRNALRMAAIMGLRTVAVLTHDSIGVGEDGPTHQPVEQCGGLRLIPNMHVWRPCDAVESAVAWKCAVERMDGPASLALTRQKVRHMERTPQAVADIERGGYVLKDCAGAPEAVIIATGSEVALAVDAADALNAAGRKVRVVSMPCADLFDAQDSEYRESVLPAACAARVAVEAGATGGWYKYVGLDGAVIGMESFGESAPGGKLFEHFGFTVENVRSTVEKLLG